MATVEQEFVDLLANGIADAIDEVIMMTKNGYKLNVETWLDPTLEYGQQRRWKYTWSKEND